MSLEQTRSLIYFAGLAALGSLIGDLIRTDGIHNPRPWLLAVIALAWLLR